MDDKHYYDGKNGYMFSPPYNVAYDEFWKAESNYKRGAYEFEEEEQRKKAIAAKNKGGLII